MKRLLYCAIALLFAMACGRQTSNMPADPQLQFNKDGKFKIVQFTDTHLSYNNREAFDKSVDVIMSIVKAENPASRSSSRRNAFFSAHAPGFSMR